MKINPNTARSSVVAPHTPVETFGPNSPVENWETYTPSTSVPMIPNMQTYQNASRGSRVSRFMEDPRAKAILSKFPASFQKQASGLSDAQFQVLHNGTKGSTKFGPITVDNKKAFIKGSVYGKSIWSTVHQQMSDAHSKYHMISKTEADSLHKVVDSVSNFSSGQREQLVRLLDMAAKAR
jgi:hypothetical protein